MDTLDHAVTATAFEHATTPVSDPAAAGVYRAVMTDGWNAPILPHGGITTVMALRAAAAELADPTQRLRTSTTVFAAQVPAGPVEIRVRVLRRGRSLSQVAVDLCPEGSEAGHHVVAAFGATRPGFELTDIEVPDVPAPEESRPFQAPDADEYPMNFWENVEGRLALGGAWWEEGWQPTPTSDRACWYRYVDPPRRGDGTLDPLAIVALADTMPGAVFQRLGPDVPECFVPSVDLTVHLFRDSSAEWLLAHNRARYAGDGYASVEMCLWDSDVGLVAYATQTMLFSFPDGPPAPHQLRP